MPDAAFQTCTLPEEVTVLAPDGAQVRVLLGLSAGTMAHFRLEPGAVSSPVTHRSVEEIWYVVAGRGRMWRRQAGGVVDGLEAGREEITVLVPGTCVTIPLGTHFQFRAADDTALEAVAITMPPWPGADEAVAVPGCWEATVGR